MKHRISVSAALLSLVAAAAVFGVYSRDRAEAATGPQEALPSLATPAQAAGNPAAQSTSGEGVNQYDPSYSWLAWQLFLKVMAPTNGSLTFETWTEECQLSTDMVGCPGASTMAAAAKARKAPKARLLHEDVLAKKAAGSDCSAMVTTTLGGYAAPSNVKQNAVFCEEVYVNPPEAAFLEAGLTTLAGQQAYGNAHSGLMNFPGTGVNLVRMALDSVEVKVDWVPASSFRKPSFKCPDPTNTLYTETINGTCYALVGIHITSKATPNWLWATFEPNNSVTNPNRCDPHLYNACLDPWGTTSSQAYVKGQTAPQSPILHRAMAAAHLNPAFNNYFLTGVQTKFVTDTGRPTQLGSSFVEFNTGVPPGHSSCITCHRYAYFNGRQPLRGKPEDNFGRPPHGWPGIGYACNQNQKDNCTPTVRNATSQDFSWVLGLMPYGAASTTPAATSKSAASD